MRCTRGAWPNRDGEYADAINAVPKHVVSTTLSEPAWQNTTVIDGGNLLDELHLWVHPHLAGVGDRGDLLIHQGLNKRLELDRVRRLDSGVVVLTLRNPDA